MFANASVKLRFDINEHFLTMNPRFFFHSLICSVYKNSALLFCTLLWMSGYVNAQPLSASIAPTLQPVESATNDYPANLDSHSSKKHLRLGIYLHQDRSVLTERYQPFIAYLKKALPDYQIDWMLYSPDDFKNALQHHQLDVLFTNPSLYQLIRFENSLGAPIATAQRIRKGVVTSSLGGTIFALASQKQINHLQDLTDVRIAIPSFSNTGAYRVPLYELHKIGIKPSRLDFVCVGTNDDVVKAVLAGQAEVGFVRTGILEDSIQRGGIQRADFKLINQQPMPAFPFWLSTQLVPEWPFFALSHVDTETVKQLTVALFQLTQDDPALQQLGLAGFQPAKDYLPLEEMLKEMNLPPFEVNQSIYWVELWQQYQLIIVALVLLLLSFFVVSGLRERLLQKVQASEQLANEARIKAQKADAAKSEFLANMSHEIRTPLNAIITMAQLGQTDERLNDAQVHHQKVQHSAQLLLRILNDLLDFSKMDAGQLKIDQQAFRLRRVLDDLKTLFAPLAQEEGLHFLVICEACQYAFDHWTLNGDGLRLGQVLSNLLSNAIKFTERGEVHLTVSLEAQENDQAWLKFCVMDTGKGIPDEQYDQLFQRFSQGDASITRQFGGTGLGLAISQRLVVAMGGKGIEFESHEGDGSRFWFVLPFTFRIDSTEPLEMLPVFSQNKRALLHGKLLLVEDNPINQEVALELLGALGVTVVVANNGQEGVDILKRERFDAVLMDIQMPVMDGYEATRQMRVFNPDVPIIALTAAAAREEELDKVQIAGMNHYLTKPIDLDALYDLLALYLPKQAR